RGELAIKVGQTLWSNYLKESRKAEDDETRLAQADLDAMESKTLELLESGVTAVQAGGEVDRTVANGVLALTQLYADKSQPIDAIRWLEDPKVGALTLVDKNDPAAQHPPYAEETYKVALRSYISALPELDMAAASAATD